MSASHLTPDVHSLIDAKCDQFERRWQEHDPVGIETLIADVPPNVAPQLFRELLLLELELRFRRGEKSSPDDYRSRFPAHGEIIESVFRHAAESEYSLAAAESASKSSERGQLEVRCPSCRAMLEVAADTELTDLTCTSCGSHFSLVDTTRDKPSTHVLAELGRFELIARVGVGGFGSVWKARDKELERTVAIKIPRQGAISAEDQEKFFREARAAAQLRHPGIVSVYEVGRDGDSVYIVSDFVRGITLSDWLASHQPSSREAAEMCAQIADALHHAHEQGVVHRDLKPANIMIDDEGQTHLMDFGLARRDVGEVTVTMEGHVLGTPAYMSPEQAQGESHSADRRSDVYSLGVILFQLVTGELPFRGNARMVMQQVIHDDPPNPKKFNAHVPKDIETISLKCLEKDPSRRYSTAHELAAELRRYLKSEPILARPISAVERNWRWSRRHPAIVSAMALAVTLIATLAIGFVMIYAAKRSADSNRQLAERKEVTVRRTLHFLQQLFRSTDPVFGPVVGWRQSDDAAQIPLSEILNRAKPTVMKDVLRDEPAIRVEVLCTLGSVYRGVGVYDGAQQFLTQARSLADTLDDNPELKALVEFQSGWLAHDLGKYDEASKSYERARQLRVESSSEKSLEVAEVDFNRAWLLADLGKPHESIALFRKVLDVRRSRLDDTSFEVQVTALALKVLLLSQDKRDDALLVEMMVGGQKDEMMGMVTAFRRAKSLRDAKRREEALIAYQALYDKLKIRLSRGHPIRVYLQVDLAGLHREMGHNEDAEQLMREAINDSKALFDSNPKLTKPLMEFARMLAARGDVDEAALLYNRALTAAQGHDPNLELEIRKALSSLPQKTEATDKP